MPSTDAQKRATIKYMTDKLEKIEFRVKKGQKEEVRKYAESKGTSLTSYIKQLIEKDSGIEL